MNLKILEATWSSAKKESTSLLYWALDINKDCQEMAEVNKRTTPTNQKGNKYNALNFDVSYDDVSFAFSHGDGVTFWFHKIVLAQGERQKGKMQRFTKEKMIYDWVYIFKS